MKGNNDKFPKVGDIFYWEDMDGDIHESTCLKIEEEDNPDIETMFYTYVSQNGGAFVTESDIVSSNSEKVKEFKKRNFEKKIDEIIELFNVEEFRVNVYSALRKSFDEDMTNNIIETLADKKNYEDT